MGINTIVDQHDIKDQESPDMQNMYFDMGVIGVRPGSKLFATKPAGETGEPLQIILAKTSDGVNYLISVYTSGTTTNNFYLWDNLNSQWLPINGTYLPTFTAVSYFGSQSWDYAYSMDSLYLGNGFDDMCRWKMSLGYTSEDVVSSGSTLPMVDASRFFIYSAAITAVNGDSTTVTLSNSPQQSAIYTNDWELGQLVFYVGDGITGLTSGKLYYAVPSAYSLPTNGISGNTLGFATSLANAVAKTTISISGSPANAQIFKAEPIVITSAGNSYNAVYYSRTGNTLNLAGVVGHDIKGGAAVAPTITDRPGCPKGNIITTWQSRLVVSNCMAAQMSIWDSSGTTFSTYPVITTSIVKPTMVSGSGNTMWLSRLSSPEDYVTNQDDMSSGGNQIFSDGAGSITDIKDFGEFLVVSKSNIQYRFSFIQNQDLSAQFPQIVPIISGIGMGPFSFKSSLKAMNTLFYPTASSGFVALSPTNTGYTSETGLEVISYNINNLIQSGYDFTKSKGVFYFNKLLWTCTNPSTQDFIFMYDTIRKAWTKFDNWNPVDMVVTNDNVFFFIGQDGNIYEGFDGYTDNDNPYNSYYKTKLHNFQKPSMVKTIDAIAVEGYMTQSTTLYADVLYNEKGRLFTQTYKMAYGLQGFIFTNVNITALGQTPINQSILDSLTPSQIQNFGYFRTFLSVPNAYGLFAVQIKFYSRDPNSIWFLTGYGMNPKFENIIPPLMRLDSQAGFNFSQNAIGMNGFFTLPDGQTLKIETPPQTADGIITAFSVTHYPKFVVVNGASLFEGDGYTVSGSGSALTINITFAPQANSTIRSLYIG